MKELLLQTRLRDAGKLVDYTGPPFFLHVRRHQGFPNLVLFKYDQINSPMNNPFVQQLRGVILDEADNWKIISRPFDKFFNYGEFNAPLLDWHNVRVYEKCDGTLIQMYHYKDEWHVGTLSTPDASGLVGQNKNLTFEELFWNTWKQTLKGNVPNEHEKDSTFLFELMTPFNRVVVDHQHPKLQLIGVRSRNGEEYHPKWWSHYNPVKEFEFPYNSYTCKADILKGLIESFETMKPLEQEGYVVVDKNFTRVKVKSPAYVNLHHTISTFNDRSLFEVIRNGESNEVIASFPQWKEKFTELTTRYQDFVTAITIGYERYKHINTQKDFATAIQDLPFCSLLFMLRAEKVRSVESALRCVHIDRFLDLLDRWEKKRGGG